MNQYLRKMSAVILAGAIALTATACGGGSSSGSESGSTPSSQAESTGTSAPADDGETVTLKVWGFDYTSTSEDLARVSQAVSEITREKIGVEVEIVRESDAEKLNLAMNSGEQWDLVNYHTFSGGLSTLVHNGMAAPIDDLVEQYGQDAAAAVGEEMMAAGVVDGQLYSIPSINVWASSYGVAISSAILDELNIDASTLKTWDDVHEAFLKMKEAHPDMYPLVPAWGGGGMQKAFAFDNLGTGFWDGLGILENVHEGSTTVVNMFETDSYREFVEMMYQWNQEGLLMPDATTTTESTNGLINTVGYASIENFTPQKKQELANGIYWKGKEGTAVEIVDPFIPCDAGGSSYFIPYVSEHPEKAMQLWNLMYTDADLANALTYGVEGEDYEFTDDTHEMVIRDTDSTYGHIGWSWPNESIAAVVEGVDVDIWDQNKSFRESAAISPALGFKFDSSMVMNEITACNNVTAKYEVGLRWGQLDPAEALPKLNEELYAAGLQTIIDEKQAQLDKFLGE